MLECYTFEYKYLKCREENKISEEEYWKSVYSFLVDEKDNINKILKKRKLDCISGDEKIIREEFEYVRKYGFDKSVVKKFREKIGGQGFKKIWELRSDELQVSCKTLIKKLKEVFGDEED